jgi:hypothetical protein
MLNHMTKKFLLFITSTTLLTMNLSLPALAKPVRIAEGVSFDLEVCRRTVDGNDVVCTGALLSRAGERRITIGRQSGDLGSSGVTYMTTSQGKNHAPSSISVGDQVCNNVPDTYTSVCGQLTITLVEGVKYRSSFVFRDVSSDSSKISLLAIAFYNDGEFYLNPPPKLKYRNLNIFRNNS